jgi:hypothetical protein
MHTRIPLIALCLAGATAPAATEIKPALVFAAAAQERPCRHAGLLLSDIGYGSGSIIDQRVVLTAAHVIFDDETGTWLPVADFYPRNLRLLSDVRLNPQINRHTAAGGYYWTAYAARAQDAGAGNSQTFNLDAAALYYVAGDFGDFALVHVDEPDAVGILRDPRRKTIVGYPVEAGGISAQQRGYMFQNPPGNYDTWWMGYESRPETWRDQGGYWNSLYLFDYVVTYSGNSGGPVFVEDDLGAWQQAGILVGGTATGDDEPSCLIRTIDRTLWEDLVEPAAAASGMQPLRRVRDLRAAAVRADAIALAWTNPSPGANAWVVYRRAHAFWAELARLDGNAASFTDNAVAPGTTYTYVVTSQLDDTRRAPWSAPLTVTTPGSHPAAGAVLGAPHLWWSTGGESGWFVDDEAGRMRSGRTRSMGVSHLETRLTGPGELRFDWQVSSEDNPDYDRTGSPDFGEIFDALYFRRNDTDVGFISGAERALFTHAVPAGEHTLSWAYVKDPYADERDDAGMLHAVEWAPGPGSPAIYASFALTAGWRHAVWWGFHRELAGGWTWHYRHGWLHLLRVDGVGAWVFDPVASGWYYLAPDSYPLLWSAAQGQWVHE